MPYSDADIVQMKPGTGLTVTLDQATSAGNTLKIFMVVGNTSAGINTPAGFARDAASSAGMMSAFGKDAAAGESSWVFTTTLVGPVAWVAMELPGAPWLMDVRSAVDFDLSTASAGVTSTYDGVAFVMHALHNTTGGVTGTLGSQTGGFDEIAEVGATDGTKAVDLALSRRWLQSLISPASTATRTGTVETIGVNLLVVYSAPGARRAADVLTCAGAELGSAAALATSGVAGAAYFDAVSNVTIEAAAARTGNYGFRCQASASISYAQWATTGVYTASRLIPRISFRFRSGLPGGDVQLGDFCGFVVWYRVASGKIGVQFSGGAEQLSDAAVSAGQWFSIDAQMDRTGTTYLCDWQVTYNDGQTPVAQAQAASPSGQTAGAMANFTIGSTASQTADFDWDDLVTSKTNGHYPLGNMGIYPLKVDPAGTLTISGTAANFNTFTANGTMAAWNAATAKAAIDEIPPTIGASADGIAQITAAASDYVDIPMETLDLASIPGSIRGVRMGFCGWAASTTAATIGMHWYDGTTDYVLLAAQDPNWDNTTESWVWQTARVSAGGARIDWTQAKLDAMTTRVGYSTDATPDIGIHAVLAEAVVRKAETVQLFGGYAAQSSDPDSAGAVTVSLTAPQSGDATLYYETNTSPTTVQVPAGTSHTETVNAVDAPTTNYVAGYWPPEGVPDA